MVEVNPIMVEVSLGKDLIVHTAIIMDIPLINATRYMGTHLVSNKGRNFRQATPMLWPIKFLISLVLRRKDSTDPSSLGDFFQNLNTSQCQQLVKLLTTQISSAENDQIAPEVIASFTVGTCLSTSINSVLSNSHYG